MECLVSHEAEIIKQRKALTHKDGEEDATDEAYGKPLQPGVETKRRGIEDLRGQALLLSSWLLRTRRGAQPSPLSCIAAFFQSVVF